MLRDDRTWKYAPCFRHGLTAISLERSLVLAGENPDEYRAHLARFDRLVEGMEPGPLSDPAKLARATALTAWRRLRALRLDREWTLRAIADVLQQAIHARELAAQSGQPLGNSPSLAPDGLGYLGPDPLFTLGLGLEDASCSWVGTWRALTRLNNRFDQLWCRLVEELGELPPFISPSVWWERGRMRPSRIVENYMKWPVEVLGNPLWSPAEIMACLADRGVHVQPVAGWHCHPAFRSLEEAENYWWRAGEQRRQAEWERLEEEKLTVAGDPHYCLLGRVRRAEEAESRTGTSKPAGEVQPLPLPETFAEFLALVERAFGPQPPSGPESANTAPGADASSVSCQELLPSSVEEGPRVVPSSSGIEKPTDDPGRVRHLAELLWQRVERVRERADDEARRLAQLLDAYGDALGRAPSGESQAGESQRSAATEAEGTPNDGGPDLSDKREEYAAEAPQATLAMEILQLFREKRSGRLRKGGNERVIRLGIYDLAVSRFSKQPDFELLKRTHDRFDQLHHEFFEIFFGQFHPERPDAGSG